MSSFQTLSGQVTRCRRSVFPNVTGIEQWSRWITAIGVKTFMICKITRSFTTRTERFTPKRRMKASVRRRLSLTIPFYQKNWTCWCFRWVKQTYKEWSESHIIKREREICLCFAQSDLGRHRISFGEELLQSLEHAVVLPCIDCGNQCCSSLCHHGKMPREKWCAMQQW